MQMTMVILTADVEDAAAWEREIRTHADLFKASGLGPMHYSVTDDGHVVMCTEAHDVSAYMEFINSKSTKDAMKNDGVKRETVTVVVLDKRLAS
jgi:hypothetical protein